jgi:hypothetical protein
MKRLLLVTTSALAISCLNTVAIADGHEDDLWTGAFVGIGGGMQSFSADGGFGFGVEGMYEGGGLFGSESSEKYSNFPGEDSFGAAEIGYDVQLGAKIVVGVVAGFDSFGGSGSDSYDSSWNFEGSSDSVSEASARLEVSSVTHVNGRVGYLIDPQTLIFASVGAVQGTGQMSYSGALLDFHVDGSAFSFSGSQDSVSVSGASFGIGAERMLQNNWSIKVEARRVEYDYDHDDEFDDYFEGNYGGQNYEVEYDGGAVADSIVLNSVRFLVTKRF